MLQGNSYCFFIPGRYSYKKNFFRDLQDKNLFIKLKLLFSTLTRLPYLLFQSYKKRNNLILRSSFLLPRNVTSFLCKIWLLTPFHVLFLSFRTGWCVQGISLMQD